MGAARSGGGGAATPVAAAPPALPAPPAAQTTSGATAVVPATPMSARLQALVVDAFDAPAVENDEAIAHALAEAEEADARAAAPPPEDVSRDVALALACQLDEMARSSSAPADARPPPDEAGAGLDAAVAAALGSVPALPWTLGRAAPPTAPGGRETDLSRLRERLMTYGLEEGVVKGDGNCQFRALADQLYRSEAYHAPVRAAVAAQLARQPERYAPFVLGDWGAYLEAAARPGTWGDHVTLQAAADAYGVRVCVVTTYELSGYLEIAPLQRRSQRSLWLSLHAEIHYNSVYPHGEVPRQGVERVAQLAAAASAGAMGASPRAAAEQLRRANSAGSGRSGSGGGDAALRDAVAER